MERRGYGTGKGQGYKNLMQIDPFIHSLNAKGIKSKKLLPQNFKKGYDFGNTATPQKKGLIRELARKVHEGVDWAIQWEKEHLPKQKEWVKKEFEQAKELAKRGVDKVKDYAEQKKEDLDDVRDELDINDDGVQDLDMSDLEIANQEITQGLNQIDLDNSGVPDHIEDGTFDMPEPPRPSGAGFPFPTTDPKRDFEKKEGVFKKGARFVGSTFKKAKEEGRQIIEKKRLEKDIIRHMTDPELRTKAIELGKPTFGKYNAFEREIIRREQEKARLRMITEQAKAGQIKGTSPINLGFLNPLGQTKPKEKKVTSKKAKIKGDGQDYFGFLNPVKTLSKKGDK